MRRAFRWLDFAWRLWAARVSRFRGVDGDLLRSGTALWYMSGSDPLCKGMVYRTQYSCCIILHLYLSLKCAQITLIRILGQYKYKYNSIFTRITCSIILFYHYLSPGVRYGNLELDVVGAIIRSLALAACGVQPCLNFMDSRKSLTSNTCSPFPPYYYEAMEVGLRLFF